VVFSAHGVPPAVRRRAEEKRLAAIDATCPFVARAHRAAREFAKSGLPVVVVGDPEHSEVKGIAGEAEDAPRPVPGCKIGVVVQTSMDVEAARRRVDELRREYDVVGVSPPCDASSARQDAVRRFDGDALLVLGSRTSANSRRLCGCARCPSFFASDMYEVRGLSAELAKFGRVGVTSGASTPERFLEDAVRLLSRR
jgi:4-hydroxy-3-methylbut-2-enyl diphosphate reductase